MKWIIGLIALIAFVESSAQGYGKKRNDCFPQTPRFEKSHWYFGPGLTYTNGILGPREVTGFSVVDTTYKSSLAHKGRVGFYGEFGRYFLIENLYFFRYWNAGVNYRWIKSSEQFTNEVSLAGATIPLGFGENSFSDHYANLHVEINGINLLSSESFLQHTFGLAAGYAVGAKRTYTNTLPGLTENTGSRIHSYLYYRIGYGFKSNKKLIIIPSLEVPLLNIYTFNKVRPDMPYFNSNYWPITLSIRFFLFRNYKLKDCPPVDAIGLPEGFDPDEPSKR
ncbi:MAG: hypothetical protein KDC83_02490 [Flavobacteriales bacterium]|nr:hypothetical protein [Flavobacteriales bacterium]